MKKVTIEPLGESAVIQTGQRLLDVLLAKKLRVKMSCGGRGVCATCHVRVCAGQEQLSQPRANERRTLALLADVGPDSRLACQAVVYGDGVQVRVPEGMYIETAEDLLSLLGSYAPENILHPVTGAVLIPKGKLITRTLLEQSRGVARELERIKTAAGTDDTGTNTRSQSTFTASGVSLPTGSGVTTRVITRPARPAPPPPPGGPEKETPPLVAPPPPRAGSELGPVAVTQPIRVTPAEIPPPPPRGRVEWGPVAVTQPIRVTPAEIPPPPPRALVGPSPASAASAADGPPPAPPPPAGAEDIRPGAQFGKYLLLECVGKGGAGLVYRALHKTLQTLVAVKFLKPAAAADPKARERLAREAQLLAQLAHPNIVRVLDYEDDPRHPFLVMEYVDGLSAADLLRQSGRLAWDRAVRLAVDVATGLQAAHRLGIVHRDVKPGNILLTRDGTGKLADLGLATTVWPGAGPGAVAGPLVMGTLGYMAPEMFGSGPTDHRADIYALGVTLFHLISGELPYTGTNSREIMVQHLEAPIPLLTERVPDVPPRLAAVVQAMMAKHPSGRYPSYADLLAELTALRPALEAAAT